MSAPTRYLAVRFIALFLTALSVVDLTAMLVIIGFHAYLPRVTPTGVLAPMTVVLAGAAGAAVLAGLAYSVLAYPAQRRSVLLLALIVAGLLGAHLYTINDPSLGTTNTLSGQVGTSVHDDQATLTSMLKGTNLTVVVQDSSASSAIGAISLSVDSAVLPASGFTNPPSNTQGLEPGNEVRGSWNLSSPPSSPLTLTYEHLTCYATDKRVDGCIMDEVYYVPAAQTILNGEKCAPYADNCNLEHPYLSKAFIAAGIAIFGNTTFGWRIFEVILGSFSVPLLFGLCWVISKNQRLSLYAGFLLAFETLYFAHSSIAVIDVGAMFFSLLGFLIYFGKVRWWKLDRIVLSAVAFGLAALAKETALFLFLVLFLYHLFFSEGSMKSVGISTTKLTLLTFMVFAAGLEIYDGAFGSGTATTFVGQIDFILKYGASLTMTPSSQGWIDTFLKTPITPLNWVTYYSPIGYLITDVTVSGATGPSQTFVVAGYYGVTNQFEVWLVYIWGAYTIYLWRKTRGKFALENEAREFGLARLALIWFLAVFVGYLGLYIYGRITYPYYFIAAVPALAMGGAYLLTRPWFPRPVAYIFLAGVFAWFFLFYPDKAFLPTWVRVLIGR